MELKIVNPNSFNVSHMPMMNNKKNSKTNSPYIYQIRELLNRRKEDKHKNDYPFYFRKAEEKSQINSMKIISNDPMNLSPSKSNNTKSNETPKQAAVKTQTNYKSKRLPDKPSVCIETKNMIYCTGSNEKVNKRKESNTRNDNISKDKQIIHFYLTTGNININKANSTVTTPGITGIRTTKDSYQNSKAHTNQNSHHYHINTKPDLNVNCIKRGNSNSKPKWKIINTSIHFNNEMDKLKKPCNSKNYNKKLIAFERYLSATGSPMHLSHPHQFECLGNNNPVTIDKLKSVFFEYKERKQISKSKSGGWLCNISPSLLYNSNYNMTNKYSNSKDKLSTKNSYIYPSNKLYQ